MIKTWKDVVEKNYDKSFDHRSFYFKQQDRRTFNIKNLLADIKGTIPPPGMDPAAYNPPPLVDIVPPEVLYEPSQANSTLLHTMEPNLFLNFRIEDHSIHGDIFNLMTHVVENSMNVPLYDRERFSALWRDWLRPLFQLPVHLLYRSSTTLALSDAVPVDPTEAWPINTKVLTVFGSGTVLSFRGSDSVYEIQLPFGRGFFKSSTIIGAEELPSVALSAIGVVQDEISGEFSLVNPSTSPDASPATGGSVNEPSTIFFGTQLSYAFLRVYHTIFTRLSLVKSLSLDAVHESASHPTQPFDVPSSTILESIKCDDIPSPSASAYSSKSKYKAYFSQLLGLLDGNIEASRYEEAVRQLLGNKAYVLYTLDKVITQGVKMMQTLSNDDSFNRLIGVFVFQRQLSLKTGSKAQVLPLKYYQHVRSVATSFVSGGEELYRIQWLNKGDYITNPQLAIQLYGMNLLLSCD